MISLTEKIYSLPEEESSKIVVFLDRAKFHVSEIVKKFFSLVKYPVFLNTPAYSDFAAIELFLARPRKI